VILECRQPFGHLLQQFNDPVVFEAVVLQTGNNLQTDDVDKTIEGLT